MARRKFTREFKVSAVKRVVVVNLSGRGDKDLDEAARLIDE